MSNSFIVVLLYIFAPIFYNDRPVVNFQNGILTGKHMQTPLGRVFFGFTGIPYAKPPVGELRFKPPVPMKEMDLGTVFDASKLPPVCPQINIYETDFPTIGDEDCLYLNVYTPQLLVFDGDLLPVMFYIHGGSFTIGGAREDWLSPDFMLAKNIVLVIANYRLGALGFLSTVDNVISGNNGLKDQNLALNWIRENIKYFGGNPLSVTVFGNSAGAICTQYHMFSPLSRGLINKAIIQSGFAVEVYAIYSKEETKTNARTLAEYLNCSTITSHDMVHCLRTKSAHEIVRQEMKFLSYDNDTTIPFRPVIEPFSSTAFLTEDPLRTISGGRFANIPIMTGIVSQEGADRVAGMKKHPEFLEVLNQKFEFITRATFGITCTSSKPANEILHFYFRNKDIDYSTINGIADMYTDGWFLLGLDTTVRLHFKHSTERVYKYLFEYRGSLSYTHVFGDFTSDFGVCHTDELLYLLPQFRIFPDYRPSDSDKKMIELMTTLWTNFAKTGNPTPETNLATYTKWDPVQSEKQEYYHIKNDNDTTMDTNLYQHRLQLWKHLPIAINKV